MKPLTIENPCDAPWNAMRRDGKSRFCGSCQKRVFDIAALTESQLRGLALVTGGRFCAQQTIVEGELLLQPEPRVRTGLGWAIRAVAAAGALGSAACSSGDASAAPLPAWALAAPGDGPGPSSEEHYSPARGGLAAREEEPLRGDVAPDPRLSARVLFADKKAGLDAAAKASLADAVAFLAAHAEVTGVSIVGHADASEGTTAEVETLARARAEAVKAFLVQAGIGAGRLTTSGYGARAPATGSDTPEQRAQNRRVEFTIY